ncbi:MAG: metal ABC transporter ATP-binding protein, partial [Nitrospinota bacterium]
MSETDSQRQGPEAAREPVVRVEDLSFTYGDGPVLEGITLSVDEGLFIGLIGPNGGGKTTFLRILLGLLKPAGGLVRVFGLPPGELGARRGLIGYVPQRYRVDPRFPATVLDVVLMGAYRMAGLGPRVPRRMREAGRGVLARVGLADQAERRIGSLSGGELQRALIARALVGEPRLLLLDEPTRGVDAAGQAQFMEFIQRLKADYALTLLLVSHDLGQLGAFSDRIACLNRHLHWHDRSELLDEEVLRRVYACELD